ncbi:MAG: hypothetical protein DRG27_06865 [Deltaproteobacteria bacterium]|nr:MAG: hypothetical protein DRG27_06865 [Deltaproteobacteria bacterium]
MKLEVILKTSEIDHIVKDIPYEVSIKKDSNFLRLYFLVKEDKEIDKILKLIDCRLREEDQLLNTCLMPEHSFITLSYGFKIAFLEEITKKQVKEKEILLKRGIAFGGFHPTTVMCLELLKKAIEKSSSKRVLDLGTGSGILSIMAEKLGASKIYAVDIDFDSCLECKENIQLNRCNNIEVICGTERSVKGRFDLIMANIIFHTLKGILKDLRNMLKNNGFLIISGFLANDTDNFSQLLGSGIVLERMEKEGWGALLWQKK